MLLIPEDAERLLVAELAAKIGMNHTGAVGLYQTGYKSACHCHVLPVKNLMLSGKKSWRFWAPGTLAKLSHRDLPTAPPVTPPAVSILQEEGDVLWIPPGVAPRGRHDPGRRAHGPDPRKACSRT